MVELKNNELHQVNGGGISFTAALAAFGIVAVTFIVGVFDGYVRPLKCRS